MITVKKNYNKNNNYGNSNKIVFVLTTPCTAAQKIRITGEKQIGLIDEVYFFVLNKIKAAHVLNQSV